MINGRRHPLGNHWGKPLDGPLPNGGGSGRGGCWPFLLGVYGLAYAAMAGTLVGSWPW